MVYSLWGLKLKTKMTIMTNDQMTTTLHFSLFTFHFEHSETRSFGHWSLRSKRISHSLSDSLYKYNFNYIYIVALKTHPRNENDQNDFDQNDRDDHTNVFSELFSFRKIWSVTIKLLSLHRKSCISASKIFKA